LYARGARYAVDLMWQFRLQLSVPAERTYYRQPREFLGRSLSPRGTYMLRTRGSRGVGHYPKFASKLGFFGILEDSWSIRSWLEEGIFDASRLLMVEPWGARFGQSRCSVDLGLRGDPAWG
jgi:hypothetical protein